MDLRSSICKITAAVLFVAAGIADVVMPDAGKKPVTIGVSRDYASEQEAGPQGKALTEIQPGVDAYGTEIAGNQAGEVGTAVSETQQEPAVTTADGETVDINTADADQLMTLPGIGAVKAEAIINYRNENGSFAEPEDLMLVPGIKEGTFNKIKERIVCGGY